jgi:hypothetical protein
MFIYPVESFPLDHKLDNETRRGTVEWSFISLEDLSLCFLTWKCFLIMLLYVPSFFGVCLLEYIEILGSKIYLV